MSIVEIQRNFNMSNPSQFKNLKKKMLILQTLSKNVLDLINFHPVLYMHVVFYLLYKN